MMGSVPRGNQVKVRVFVNGRNYSKGESRRSNGGKPQEQRVNQRKERELSTNQTVQARCKCMWGSESNAGPASSWGLLCNSSSYSEDSPRYVLHQWHGIAEEKKMGNQKNLDRTPYFLKGTSTVIWQSKSWDLQVSQSFWTGLSQNIFKGDKQ